MGSHGQVSFLSPQLKRSFPGSISRGEGGLERVISPVGESGESTGEIPRPTGEWVTGVQVR